MTHMADAGTATFTQGSLMRHVTVMSLTASIGLMAIFIVDLVDIFFISLLGIGALAAAAGYASMVMFFASAINIGLSIAAGALVAQALGAGRRDEAREMASSVAVVSVMAGVAVPVLALPNLGFLLGLLGAEGEVAAQAALYVRIILPTTMISGVGMVAVATLRAHGDARGAMYPALLGGLVNGVADPILIFGLGLGLPGAAMATVVARFVTLAMALWLAQRKYRAFARPCLRCVRRDLSRSAGIGVPAVLATVATPVGAAIVTRQMAQFGTDAVAGLAVINRLIPVAFSVILALSGAIGPIIGQNFGAARLDRVREAFLDGILFVAVYVFAVAGLLYLLRAEIAAVFDLQEAGLTLLLLFCGPLALASFFNGVIFVANASFNNLGHPGYSTWVNWGRHTLGTWPFAIWGAQSWGAPGVLIGQAAGGAVFAAIAAFLAVRVMARPDAPPADPVMFGNGCPNRRMQVLFGRRNR